MELEQLAFRMAQGELELEAKGYDPERSRMAVRRAARWSGRIARMVPAGVRQEVFGALLEEQLQRSEDWLRGLDAARENQSYQRGLRRAARDGRLKEGMGAVLPAKEIEAPWRESHERAGVNWDRTAGGRA